MKTYMRTLMLRGIHLLIFFSALYILDYVELGSFESTEYEELQIIHRDILIPSITLTDEIKTGMFFDGLRIDVSMIKTEDILESIGPWEHYIERYSSNYNVDPDLVRAIIYAESKGDPHVVSRDGAEGLMQLMPLTSDFMGISNPFDPEENIKAGVKYIAWLVKYSEKYNDTHVLWAWNAGPSMIHKNIIPGETRKFIIKVLSLKTLLKDNGSSTI
ncbi:lytic transglycosylase domain-containing protein [Candidatus Latescibacterota bacterium]